MSVVLRRIALALAAWHALAGAASACEPPLNAAGVDRIEGKHYVVVWRADPAAFKVSDFFSLDVAACDKSGAGLPAQLRVDAVMPEHKHGMNYRPTVTRHSDGSFRAEGLLFHMPGLWEFSFDVRGTAASEVLRARVTLR